MTAPNLAKKLPASLAAPCAITCTCGLRHVAAIDNEVTGRERANAIMVSASLAGWYVVAGVWLCGRCFAGEVRQAAMLRRAGQPTRMREIDEAAEKRANYVRMDVRTVAR